MIVGDFMKKEVVSVPVTASIGEAAVLFVHNHIGTLPVVDAQNKLVGILHMRDLLKLVMPAFVTLIADFDFVRHDFGDYEHLRPSPEMESHPVSELMEKAESPVILPVGLGRLTWNARTCAAQRPRPF